MHERIAARIAEIEQEKRTYAEQVSRQMAYFDGAIAGLRSLQGAMSAEPDTEDADAAAEGSAD